MPRSFCAKPSRIWASAAIARDGELRAADLLPAEQVADRLDGLELVVEVGFEVEFHRRPSYRLRTLAMPCCSRMAARLVLATSSAKALSRKTQVVSPGRGEFLVPLDDALRQRLHLAALDLLGEAGDQDAAADGVHVLAGDRARLDGHAEVEAELEQQLVEDVRLGAVGLQVLDGVEQRLVEVVAVRLPRADVAGVELEDAEAEVAANIGFSSLIFFAARRRRSLVSSAMLRGLPSLSQNSAATFWSLSSGSRALGAGRGCSGGSRHRLRSAP